MFVAVMIAVVIVGSRFVLASCVLHVAVGVVHVFVVMLGSCDCCRYRCRCN